MESRSALVLIISFSKHIDIEIIMLLIIIHMLNFSLINITSIPSIDTPTKPPPYHPNLSNIPAPLTSLFLLPPGNAPVQSTNPLESTPNIPIFSIAGTKALSHAPLLTANVFIGIPVTKCFAIFPSLPIVMGAFPLIVSE